MNNDKLKSEYDTLKNVIFIFLIVHLAIWLPGELGSIATTSTDTVF